jgi:hypothetical protein
MSYDTWKTTLPDTVDPDPISDAEHLAEQLEALADSHAELRASCDRYQRAILLVADAAERWAEKGDGQRRRGLPAVIAIDAVVDEVVAILKGAAPTESASEAPEAAEA